jgi:CBS domain-containing protein
MGTVVRDVMATSVVSASPEQSLRSLATRLTDNEIGAACVHEGCNLVGVVSERDVARALADGADPDTTCVDEVMSRSPATVAPEAALDDAAAMMVDCGVRHLPVVSGDLLVGMLSVRDLIGLVSFDAPPGGVGPTVMRADLTELFFG